MGEGRLSVGTPRLEGYVGRGTLGRDSPAGGRRGKGALSRNSPAGRGMGEGVEGGPPSRDPLELEVS